MNWLVITLDKENKDNICELCRREDVKLTEHHLIPREEGGQNEATIDICIPCHKQIHALYTNKELAIRLNSLERLRDDDEIKKYLKWIKKQPSSRLVPVKKSKRRKRR